MTAAPGSTMSDTPDHNSRPRPSDPITPSLDPTVGDDGAAQAFGDDIISVTADSSASSLAHHVQSLSTPRDLNSSSCPDDANVVPPRVWGIWSSLFTIESTAQYVSSPPEPSKRYNPLTNPKPGDPDEEKHFMLSKRHQTLATAIAIIGAFSPDWRAVTACSTEITLPTSNVADATVILRIAQNQVVHTEELQKLLDIVVQEVLCCDQTLWATREDRQDKIVSITLNVLLPLVVVRCRTKILAILKEPYSTPFRAWYGSIDKSTIQDAVDADNRDLLSDSFETINTCLLTPKEQRDKDLVLDAVLSAKCVFDHNFHRIFEQQWALEPSEDTRDEEYIDDLESLDPKEMRKSGIQRFLQKLARYFTACQIVVRELVALQHTGNPLSIKMERVPFLDTTSTPSNENEFGDLDSFLRERIGIQVSALDSKKIDGLRDRWRVAWKDKSNLFLHAEMQLVLFYALNPQLFPVQGFIGVSKYCCWTCDFVLKRLQSTRDPNFRDTELDRYTEDAAGSPILFTVAGSHSSKYSHWSFPNPSKYTQFHQLDQPTFNKVCCRFQLVREDLENALVKEVKLLIPKLLKEEEESDSSGLSDGKESQTQIEIRTRHYRDHFSQRRNKQG